MIRATLALSTALLAASVVTNARADALSLVPADAATVGVVHLADLRSGSLSSVLFQQTDKIGGSGDAEDFLREAGLQPSKDVDVLVVATSPRSTLGSEADVLVIAEGRFNVPMATAAIVKRGAVKKGSYYRLPEGANSNGRPGALAFPDDHLAIMGTEPAVIAALQARAAGGTSFASASGLGREMSRIDPHASAWALVDVARAQRLTGAHVPSGSNPDLTNAMKNVSTLVLWATDTGDSLKLGGLGVAHDAETLQLLEDTIRGALAAMRLAVQDKSPDMVAMLRNFDVSHKSDSVEVTGSIPAATVKSFIAKQHASITK